MGVCVSSTLAEYRKLVPISRPRQDYISSTRVGQMCLDVEMMTPEDDTSFDAQIKRRRF